MSRLPWLLGAILPLVARAPKSSWLPSGAGEGEGVSPAWLSGIAATAAAVAVGGGVAAVALTQRPIVPAKRKESFLSDAAGIAKARCTSWFQPPAWAAASTSEDEEDSDACVPCHHDSDFEEDPDDEDGLEIAGAPHSTGAQTAPPAAQPSPSSLPPSRAHQVAPNSPTPPESLKKHCFISIEPLIRAGCTVVQLEVQRCSRPVMLHQPRICARTEASLAKKTPSRCRKTCETGPIKIVRREKRRQGKGAHVSASVPPPGRGGCTDEPTK